MSPNRSKTLGWQDTAECFLSSPPPFTHGLHTLLYFSSSDPQAHLTGIIGKPVTSTLSIRLDGSPALDGGRTAKRPSIANRLPPVPRTFVTNLLDSSIQ
jgi:hypothetical protein